MTASARMAEFATFWRQESAVVWEAHMSAANVGSSQTVAAQGIYGGHSHFSHLSQVFGEGSRLVDSIEFEERSAIIEYEGNFTRSEAERRARWELSGAVEF